MIACSPKALCDFVEKMPIWGNKMSANYRVNQEKCLPVYDTFGTEVKL